MTIVDPWGPLDWLRERAPALTSSVRCIGGLGPEDRCVAVPQTVSQWRNTDISVVCINDPPSAHTQRTQQKTEANWQQLRSTMTRITRQDGELLAQDQAIVDGLDGILQLGPAHATVILDISALPKRYFFIYLKLLLSNETVQNVVVTYALPGPTGHSEAHLSEDPDEMRALPGFAPSMDPTTLVVAVGFESLGLPQFLSEYRDKSKRIVLLVPFPPGQPYAQRTWQMLQRLGVRGFGVDARRVAAVDAFDVIRQLRTIERNERAKAAIPERVQLALAPYGPKPISLGMALYAIREDSPVFYTQPRVYHPDYTKGVGEVWAYVVKYQGNIIAVE